MDPKSLPKPSAKQVIRNMTPEAKDVMWAYVALMQKVAPKAKITWAL